MSYNLSFVNLPYVSTEYSSDYPVKVVLTKDSQPVSGQSITWSENNGNSHDGEEWRNVLSLQSEVTDSNGEATCFLKPKSGIRLIRAEYTYGNNEQVSVTSYIGYSIEKEYGFELELPVVDGKAECDISDLPLGLYDLKVEFVDGATENECNKYDNEEYNVGVHRKIGIYFDIDTSAHNYNQDKEWFEDEVARQFTIPVRIMDEYGFPSQNMFVTTTVNDDNEVMILSKDTGEVIRHHCNKVVDSTDTYKFSTPQTRDYTGAKCLVYGHTIPLTPIISYMNLDNEEYYIDEDDPTVFRKNYFDNGVATNILISEENYTDGITLDNYIYTDFRLRGRAFYYLRKYDRFGEEVRKNSSGDVYKGYDSLGMTTYYIWDGTTKTTTTESVYNSAERYHMYYPIPSSDMVWRSGAGAKLVTGVTSAGGIATVNYLRKVLGVNNFYANIENNPYVNESYRFKVITNTLPKMIPVVTNNITGTQHYKEPCKLNCIVRDSESNPLSERTVVFMDSNKNTIGTVKTGSNGYCEVDYIPQRGTNFNYLVSVDAVEIYDKVTETFTVVCGKQQPSLTVSGSTLECGYGDEYIISVNLKESSESSPQTPMVGYNISLALFNIDSSSTSSIGSVLTGNDGSGNFKFKVNTSGTYKINASLNGNSLYENTVAQSDNILFNPKKVSFINSASNTCDGGIYGQHTINLVDKTEKGLSNHSVLIRVTDSNGNTVRKYSVNSDSNGLVGVSFVSSPPSTSFTNILPVNIGSNNIDTYYNIKYSFNTSDPDCATYNHHESIENTVKYTFTKIPTRLETPYLDSEVFKVKLVTKNDGTALSGKTVKFIEGSTTVSKTTDSNGIATIEGTDVSSGDHTFNPITFEGDSTYSSSSTNGSWTNSYVEDCTSLATFTPLTESWYSSYENSSSYMPSSRKTVKLRTQCGNRYTSGTIDEEYGIHARTGVVMRCNSIATSSNCNITFKLRLVSNRSDGGFGGHFGLMNPSMTSAEMAPARFELFLNPGGSKSMNAIYIHNNSYDYRGSNPRYYLHASCSTKRCYAGKSMTLANCNLYRPHGFNMNISMNKWYNMLFQVRGNYVTCKNLDTGESYIGYTGNTVGLNPYIMVYLNYCEMIVREIKIEHL